MKLIRVAIVGTAGTGKSFLVNSILGYPAVKHEVSAGPVTLESSCHVEGEDAVLELVDTPGLCGQGEVRRTVQEDLTTFTSKFQTLDKVVVVIRGGRQRFETSERKEIKDILDFVDYKNNPENVLFLMNDGRQKNISEKQKEMELSAALRMLGIEDYEICKPGKNVTQNSKVSPAVAVSNCEDANFTDEINYVRSVLNKKNTIKSIVPSTKKEGANILICVGILLLLFMFSYNYFSYTYDYDTLTDKQRNFLKKSFEEDYDNLKEDEDILTSEIRKFAEATKNLRISINKYEVKYNEHLQENTNLTDKETNVKSNIEELKKENKDLTQSVIEKETKFIVLKEDNTNLRERETTVKFNIEQIDIENKHLNNLASEDERKLNDLKEENTNLKDKEATRNDNIEELKNENKKLKKSADDNDQTFTELTEENTNLKYKETNVKSNIEKHRKENKDLTKSVSEKETKFIVVKDENTNLRDRETTVKNNIEKFDIENKYLNNLASEDKRKFNVLKEENTNLKNEEATRKTNIEQLKNENKKLKKSVDVNDQTFTELRIENKNLKDNETAVKLNIEELLKDNKKIQDSAINDDLEMKTLKEGNTKMKEDYETVKSAIRIFEKENESLKESVDEICQKHLQTLHNDLASCESSWVQLKISFTIIIGISLIFCFSFYTLKKQDLSDNQQINAITGLDLISEDEDEEEFTQDRNYKNPCKDNTNLKDKETNVKPNIKQLRKENKDIKDKESTRKANIERGTPGKKRMDELGNQEQGGKPEVAETTGDNNQGVVIVTKGNRPTKEQDIPNTNPFPKTTQTKTKLFSNLPPSSKTNTNILKFPKPNKIPPSRFTSGAKCDDQKQGTTDTTVQGTQNNITTEIPATGGKIVQLRAQLEGENGITGSNPANLGQNLRHRLTREHSRSPARNNSL